MDISNNPKRDIRSHELRDLTEEEDTESDIIETSVIDGTSDDSSNQLDGYDADHTQQTDNNHECEFSGELIHDINNNSPVDSCLTDKFRQQTNQSDLNQSNIGETRNYIVKSIRRRRRSQRRRCNVNEFGDYDHDGDIDKSEDGEADTDCCTTSSENNNDWTDSTNHNANGRTQSLMSFMNRRPFTDNKLSPRLRSIRKTKLQSDLKTHDIHFNSDTRIVYDRNVPVKNSVIGNNEKQSLNSDSSLNYYDKQSATLDRPIERVIWLINRVCSNSIWPKRQPSIDFRKGPPTQHFKKVPISYRSLDNQMVSENQVNMASGYNKIQTLTISESHKTPQRFTSRSKLRESQRLNRILLLLIIICTCCLILWKLYEVLTEDLNYLGVVETPSVLGSFEKYAVSTDAEPCAKVGSSLLAKGGSAVDAAIGTLVCMGIALPNSLGLGGGCLMTIYDRQKKEAIVIDGREVAPSFAHENMYSQNPQSASRGPLSVGVPGEIAAYWKAHQKYGKLNWSELFDPNIELAEKGIPVVKHLSNALKNMEHSKYITQPLAQILTNTQTGQFYLEGEVMPQKALAESLRRLRDNGAGEFYGGLTGQLFIDDLKKQGGNMSMEDLIQYDANIKQPLKFELDPDLVLHTQPLPGSGIVLSIILRIMKEFGYYKNVKPQKSFEAASLYYHRLVEAFKFAYAQRAGLEDKPDDPERLEKLMMKLMSSEYIQEVVAKIDNSSHEINYYGGNEYFAGDHGTAHVSVIDENGNAAAITSSVNLYFGSGLISPSTGIIYNDVMDDFVSPNITNKFKLSPSNYNRIRPGRRPLSSMSPSIFTDSEGNVKLIIGASGGTMITTSVATVSLRHCFLEEDIKTAIDSARLHHQYLPDSISYEANFYRDLLTSLAHRGHSLQQIQGRSSVVMAIANDQAKGTNQITANSDYRKGGSVDGL